MFAGEKELSNGKLKIGDAVKEDSLEELGGAQLWEGERKEE